MAKQQQAAQNQQQQQNQQPPIPIREMGITEVVALAWRVYNKRKAQGKSSRRISFPLRAHLLPPPDGDYSTFMGTVRIRTAFRPDQGQWWVTVVLPPEGFKVQDHLNPSNPLASPDVSQT